MARFTRTQRIARPRAEVWAFFDDFANAPKWITGVSKTELVGSGPMQVGARFRETRTVAGRTETNEIEITTYDPPRKYAATARVGGGEMTYTYTFTEAGNSTDVELVAEITVKNFLYRLFVPIGFAMMKKYDGDQLDRLKTAIEGQNASSRAA